MKNIIIDYLDYYIPENSLSINEFLGLISDNNIPGGFKSKEEYKVYIQDTLMTTKIPVIEPELMHEMPELLLKKMFATEVIHPNKINLVILAQEKQENPFLNLAQYLQNKFNMKNAYTVNLSGNYCTNTELAIKMAKDLMIADDNLNNVLIVAIKKVETMEKRIYTTYGLVGDAAGIVLISNNEKKIGIKLLDTVINSCPEFWNQNFFNIHEMSYLKFLKLFITNLKTIIEKNKLSDEKIFKIILHNTNNLLLSESIRMSGLDKNKIFTENQRKYCHFDQVDLIINLKTILDNYQINKGQQLISIASGFAGAFVSALFGFES